MLWYLNDLMEDATDFLWGSAKAAHAVLLCEIERGSVTWTNMSRIDRIRRAHAQKHHVGKQNWGKKESESKTPWFCKSYQFGQCLFNKDHEQGGKMHKHICSHCLSQGKILAHPQKDCNNVKRQNSKNEFGAAQHQQAIWAAVLRRVMMWWLRMIVYKFLVIMTLGVILLCMMQKTCC